MTPAPYTRDTVAVIRNQAEARTPAVKIAAALGWDVAMLKRVAHKHSVQLSNGEPSILPSAGTAITDGPLLAVMDDLSVQEAEILRVLARANEGAFKSAREIGIVLGGNISNESIVKLVANIRDRLEGTRWKIDSRKSSDGGYRLRRFGGDQGSATHITRSTYGEIDIGPQSTIDEVLTALPARQSQIVRLLADNMGCEPISSRQIMAHLGIILTRNSVNQAINRASKNLSRSRYRIKARGRDHANEDRGYCLVMVKP